MILQEKVDTTLFCKQFKNDILVCQIYIDDIIFGSTKASLWKEFAKSIQEEFEMSLMGELKFFLGIQINQSPEGTYIHQSKYVNNFWRNLISQNVSPKKSQCIPRAFWKRKR